MLAEAAEARKNIVNLLGYAEALLKAGERTITDLAKDAVIAFHETDIVGLEGVSVPSDESIGGWLKIARLQEVQAPTPDDHEYLEWLIPAKPGQDPFAPPSLEPVRLIKVTPEEASDLVEAGLAMADDVMPSRAEAKETWQVDVLLKLANLTEFATAFDKWVAGPWADWERAERPRRKSIRFYNQLFEIQQRSLSMGEDAPVEMIFGVGLARWLNGKTQINAPLIEASVELELETNTGAITVMPQVQAPRLMLQPFDDLALPAVGRLQKEAGEKLDRAYNDPDLGFSPHLKLTFEPVLRMCQARLAADSIYEPDIRPADDRRPPPADARLRVTDGWVLYARQRSTNFRCDDIRRLKAAIEAAENGDLPEPVVQMTTRRSNKPTDGTPVDLTTTTRVVPGGPAMASGGSYAARGKLGTTPASDGRVYFFPLPHNDEQIAIACRLDEKDVSGAVVQGPPGTGKTHTIANIVAHYMATGRRVLVTAHEPEALSAIQSKLPESIRDLTISVIHSDREGARSLEQAVEILASQVKLINLNQYDRLRRDLEAQLAIADRDRMATDEQIEELALQNMTTVAFRGADLTPMELADRVLAERPAHTWFPDQIGPAARFDPNFTEADIAEARRLRQELGRDLIYGVTELPDPVTLPELPRILATHRVLIADNRKAILEATGNLPIIYLGQRVEDARVLHAWLDEAAGWSSEVGLENAWLAELYRLLLGESAVHEAVRSGVASLCVEWTTLCVDWRVFALRGILTPDVAPTDASFDAAVEALAEGRKPFGLFAFGKNASKTKAQLDGVRLDGVAPCDAAGWTTIRDHRAWQRRAVSFSNKWTAAAAALGFPAILSDGWPGCEQVLLKLGGLVERMYGLHNNARVHVATVAALFPCGVDARRVVFHFELAGVREAIAAALEQEEHADAYAVKRALSDLGASAKKEFQGAVADIAEALGNPDVAINSLADGWREVRQEAVRLAALKPARARLQAISDAVAMSGAPKWAMALIDDPVAAAPDPWTPQTWRKTWEWARADSFVRQISDRDASTRLELKRAELVIRHRELMGELVRVRTFIGLKQGITEQIASALQKFAMKVRQLGAGTGKAAERHRRGIREATLEAAGAVPCWILPEWRVAEQLPSKLAAFDLVVVDEASQSDITALPAVLRGKKLLVVGDDKQVSPSAVGMEERTVIQLRETFLRGMDIANFLEPTTSLYDLASITFPGSVIMLQEHFRCVEPIIAFSSRFYPKALIPLRVPTSAERLDPPLIDVYIPYGRKERDINVAEADFIVSEVAMLAQQPEYGHRTIGVVSMIGEKQAKHIYDRLVATIGTVAMTKHRIMCGNASTFQGQERDIIFLSMVACPRTARAQTARLMEQRFNVALSRARDRMYLVRSVAASMLNPTDLKAAVIEHFHSPMAHIAQSQNKDVLQQTESGFERDVGNLLLDRGYRLRPQVQVGSYRIDFVVEGEGDRRLAVELDGDRYHGPDRWFEDMHRQRALERIGWTFWRCWGSHWLADRQGCFNDLVAKLSSLGIEPIGGDYSPQVYTEHRTIDEPAGLGSDVARAASADADRPIIATVEQAPAAEKTTSGDAFLRPATGEVVELGDTVIVRFEDNRVRRFRLSDATHDPDRGEVGAGQPITQALLGVGIEEEVEMEVDGGMRRVIVEKITKPAEGYANRP